MSVGNYAVLLRRSAEKELQKIAHEDQDRLMDAMVALGDDPRPVGCTKLGAAGYRIRVGSYRIIYEVDDDAREVEIVRVRHRRDAYRNL